MRFLSILALILCLSLSAQAQVDPALEGVQAEQFVKKLSNEAIDVLSATKDDPEARRPAFQELLNKNFDMDMIARFALGRYWSVATPEEQKRYTQLFKKMVVDVYAKRFEEYSDQTVKVLGNKPAGRKDVIVNSQIVSASGGAPISVDWRVRKGRVIDVIVEGVSMSVTQRSEFASIIQRGGGEISALLEHLEQ